ncbi:SDR family NAD(P)-dependent oxidoreductase [Deltaproteobacteria bacterium TL4]
MEQLKGEWALITGAGNSLGVEFARQLAIAGVNLVLTSKRIDRLRRLKAEFEQMHEIDVHLICSDLTTKDGAQRLYQQIAHLKVPIALLVNNAEMGFISDFKELALQQQLETLQLNIASLTELTYLCLNGMLIRKKGWILQVSSLVGNTPHPHYAVYAASKAYVLSFAEALHFELKDFGIMVTALCPGPITQEAQEGNQNSSNRVKETAKKTPEAVVKAGLDGVLSGKLDIIPGVVNQLASYSQKLAPKRFTLKAMAHLNRKS